MPRVGSPVLDTVNGVIVVRDDLFPGGTKARVLPLLFDEREEYVYAGPCQGYAQLALALCAPKHGKRATLFCAARAEKHQRTLDALAAGANVIEVRPGYLSVVLSRAAAYCATNRACLLPFGLHDARLLAALAAVARMLPVKPTEVWTVAGSGTLSLALQQAWPSAEFHAVVIGKGIDKLGRAKLWQAPERFEQNAKLLPPFPSCSNYDAKAWRFISEHARPGALFWNVAA